MSNNVDIGKKNNKVSHCSLVRNAKIISICSVSKKNRKQKFCVYFKLQINRKWKEGAREERF